MPSPLMMMMMMMMMMISRALVGEFIPKWLKYGLGSITISADSHINADFCGDGWWMDTNAQGVNKFNHPLLGR